MDEITLGWIKIYRKAYPKLSVTMEAKSSGSGAPGLISGNADMAPVGREMLPAEEKAFVNKFGYEPTAIRVATGSLGSLGKTATTVVLVDKDNPVKGLSLGQLDAIYSITASAVTRTSQPGVISGKRVSGKTGRFTSTDLPPRTGLSSFSRCK